MIFDRLQKSTTISTSAELAEALGVGYQSSAGVSVTPKEAARFAPVYSCIKVLAESVGMLPLNLFEQKGKVREKARSHSLFNLINLAPNSYMTSQEWRETMVAHLCLRGNHYSWVNRINGQVRELLPLNPDGVTPVINSDWSVDYKVTFPDGSQRTLAENQIFHVRLMSMDGLTGLSPIAQARNSIGLGMAAERFGSRLFKNGTRPSGLLSTDTKLNQEQMQLMSKSWREANSGEDELRTAILGGGLKWTAISISPEDAQFLETRKYQRSEIAGIFRVPAHMINDMEKATFSNIEHQDIAFVVHTLTPWVTRFEQRIAVSLLTAQERAKFFAKFNVNALLRGDMKSRADYMWKRFQMGSLSPNDIRDFEDENPIENGDTYWVPANMIDPKDNTEMQQIGDKNTGDDNA